jgi:hypothetical protein
MIMKQKQVQLVLLLLFSYLMITTFSVSAVGATSGVIFHYREENGRMWAAWVTSDIDSDGMREIGIAGAIYTKCLDLAGNILWDQWGLHHEVVWGCDSGIDVNGDGITEQLAFEAVWNNHYLLDGKTGVAMESDGEENRRSGLYWPFRDCGFGLDVNVNGKGHNDYVITGVTTWGVPIPVVQCMESDNGTKIWEYPLSQVTSGIRPIMINGTQYILVISNYAIILSTQGIQLWNRTASSYSIDIIPNGGGPTSDALIYRTGLDLKLVNASNNKEIWSIPQDIHSIKYCGDVNNDGIGDYGGLWPSGKKVGLFSGADGSLIRNHTAQNLSNYMHGITYCGDVNNDTYDDYGIYGDFSPHEVFSGLDGTQLLAISGSNFHGAEEMYLVEDVNGNGSPDIMLFNGGVTVIDGATLGYVDLTFQDVSGFNLVLGLIGIIGIAIALYLFKMKQKLF